MTVQEGPRHSNKLLMLAGHYSWVLLAVTAVLTVASDATARRFGALNLAASAAWASWGLSLLLADKRYHVARLCERCIAAAPLDPQASVDRWRRALLLEHSTVKVLLVFLGLWGLNLWVNSRHTWLGYVTDISFIAVVAAVWGAEYIHRRLYPWCPYCHWDEGGDHESSPDVPAPAVSR